MKLQRTILAVAMAGAIAGCAVGPVYQRPAVETPVAFKEGQGEWVRAVPADMLERGPWWQLFQDPVLNALAAQVEVSNQNVAVAVAAYAQARALTAQQRASLFPTVDLSVSANRSGGGGAPAANRFQVGLGGGWEPDVWGRLRTAVNAANAGEQASLADLQSAKLSAQSELALNYFNLRQLDSQIELQKQTIAGYERSQTIATNRYNAGIVAKTDVLQSQTQLINARADMLGLERQRATLEHA
ncbi:TolC family protein, partial [Caenimonas koreensis]|uniref:TolC family protein n=1 Tax=Caenimonas koreensis TaxID=367474 RepID=UPI003783EACA